MDKKTMEYMKVRVDRAVVIENKLKKANAVLKSLRDGQYNFLCPRAQGWRFGCKYGKRSLGTNPIRSIEKYAGRIHKT